MYNLSQINVTDDDIAKVEQHFGFLFNDEQKTVIRTWGNVNIQACPGSGKTTTLAAKLMILADKLPKSFHQGICILTHTNIAVDEIKKKLGSCASFYNNYPNHFGTIQSFVDKYLTIPAYKMEYKQSPKIDSDLCFEKIYKKGISEYGATSFLNRKNIDSMADLFFNIHNFNISKKLEDIEAVVGTHTTTYQTVLKVKNEVLSEGYLKYDEAYSLAFKYLRNNHQLVNLFSKRFPIVFIDEMQDMETHQSKLITDLFGNSSAIIQKIGDTNQSIFSPFAEQEPSDWDISINTLRLNITARLSDHLARIVSPICITSQPMEGNWNSFPLIKPTIIVFNDNTIERVKEKFAELVVFHKLSTLPNATFKAIGHIKYNDRLGVRSYWSDFNKSKSVKSRDEFDNLFSYLEKCQVLILQKNVKDVRKAFLECICKALKLAEINNPITKHFFTPFTFTEYLSSEKETESKEINKKLSNWILNFQHTPEIRTEIVDYIKSLIQFFGKSVDSKLNYFLTDLTSAIQAQLEPQQIYEHQDIQVVFDTIHGVKGETHTATLYLETFWKLYDIGGKILPFILSPRRPDKACKKRLPLAYVAMSRPTHFLCLAVHSDRFRDGVKAYFEDVNNGWEVEFA